MAYMNKRANIMIGLMMFILALGVFVVYMSPMGSFIEIARGSNNLNCRGYIDEVATVGQNYSYNPNANTDTLSCMSLTLMLPFFLLVFIVGGIYNLLRPGGSDFFGSGGGITDI